jgi:hypothetical protein
LKFSLRAIFSMLCPGRNRVVHAAFPESYRPPDHLGIGRKSRQSQGAGILPRSGTGPELRIANAQIKCE